MMKPSSQRHTSLRGWLSHLEATDRLARTRPGISLRYELAALAKRLDGQRATWFSQPAQHRHDVVSGLLSDRAWVAEAMGVEPGQVAVTYQRAIENPLSWCETSSSAPVQSVVNGEPDLRRDLPIPVHNEHDAGAYITAGLVVAVDPESGAQNVSINRLQVSSGNRLGVLILPRDLHRFYDRAEAAGAPLEVAIVIGVDPLTLLASQAIVPLGVDEFTIAGALHGAPLEMVKCVSNHVRVPAGAEIVIEGRILPGERATEGPFGEFPQYYGPAGERQVIEVDTITHREQPLYHTIVPAAMEHLVLGAIPREASLLTLLKRTFPGVLDVYLTRGGVCRYHLVIKIRRRFKGEAKNILMAALSGHADIKMATAVDEDVDIHDADAVEWAMATRFQAATDLVVVPGAQGSRLDPSARDGLVDKVGIDATIPVDADPFRYTVVHVPGEDDPALEGWLE